MNGCFRSPFISTAAASGFRPRFLGSATCGPATAFSSSLEEEDDEELDVELPDLWNPRKLFQKCIICGPASQICFLGD